MLHRPLLSQHRRRNVCVCVCASICIGVYTLPYSCRSTFIRLCYPYILFYLAWPNPFRPSARCWLMLVARLPAPLSVCLSLFVAHVHTHQSTDVSSINLSKHACTGPWMHTYHQYPSIPYSHTSRHTWLAFKIPGLKDHIKWVQLELQSWFYIFAMKRAP